jgi:hypothetical protein
MYGPTDAQLAEEKALSFEDLHLRHIVKLQECTLEFTGKIVYSYRNLVENLGK